MLKKTAMSAAAVAIALTFAGSAFAGSCSENEIRDLEKHRKEIFQKVEHIKKFVRMEETKKHYKPEGALKEIKRLEKFGENTERHLRACKKDGHPKCPPSEIHMYEKRLDEMKYEWRKAHHIRNAKERHHILDRVRDESRHISTLLHTCERR